MAGDQTVDIKFRIFGGFVFKKRKGVEYQVYEAGFVYWKLNVKVKWLKVGYLRYLCQEGIKNTLDLEVPEEFVMWYKEKGKTWMNGKRRIDSNEDINGFKEARHKDGYLELFCTISIDPTEMDHDNVIDPILDSADPSKSNLIETGSKPTTSQTTPAQIKLSSSLNDGPSHTKKTPTKALVSSVRRSPRLTSPKTSSLDALISPLQTDTSLSQTKLNPDKSLHNPDKALQEHTATNVLDKQPISSSSTFRRSPRFSKCSEKGKGQLVGTVEDTGVSAKERRGKARRVLHLGDDDESGSSSSDGSDLDIDWEPGEEEGDLNEEKGLDGQSGGEILGEVDRSLELVRKGGVKSPDRLKQLSKEIVGSELELYDEGNESEDLVSLHGSDEEQEESPWFREDTDFKKPIVLVDGLQFSNSIVLRKALRTHAVENRYEYYYLHNGGDRITTFCNRRCQCEWNSKRSNLPECKCSDDVRKCDFKVSARRLYQSSVWQIKDLRLKHKCVRSKMNSKLTSEYLAEKYVEDWRSNPTWSVRSFREKVLSDLGIEVGYSKGWLSRSRAKLMIYGSALEQYAKVWDYGEAVIKYNPGSHVCVVVDGLDKPDPPVFQRMYMCLSPLRSGFNKGCRPLIGLDGCHLKGAYPGQILVAVGKDGNNQIFPFAWATVEVENKDSWTWFLRLLQKALGDVTDGCGLTFMSDRQKGLLEALESIVPNAEIRFCVRHIWANFKLQFTGSTFKELFWSAARATTLVDFEVAMESIKTLSEDAYEYLANIPPKHWSRRAFSTQCKSNMLLNNVCETFNSVIREARDKPILTQMEWMRRYMMKRNTQKWEAAKKMEGKVTPYVTKVFEKIERVARHCTVQVSRGDTYEVELNGDQVLVDLGERSCSCFHWQLTGIPCVHAFACILDKRVDPEDYVDPFYSRETYILAYEDSVKPMPGPKYWERVNLQQPLPPVIRVMPGRPKSKKRRLEKGEASQTKQAKFQKRCKKCQQPGHYAKSCKNPPMEAQPAQSKPSGKPAMQSAWLEEQRRKKQERAAKKTAEGAGPWSIANKKFPQEQQHHHSITRSQSSPSQAILCQSQGSTTTTVQTKKQGRGKRQKK